MYPRYTKALTTLAVAGAIAVPAVAQARGGSDDPPNHEQLHHQVRGHVRHNGAHRSRHNDRVDNDRLGGGGSDDGPNHT